MKRIIPYLALSATLLLFNGCGQPQPPIEPKKCIYPTLYESKVYVGKPFKEIIPVDANRSIFYNDDVLGLHDGKEYYKQEVLKSNKTKRYLNKIWSEQ